ncbi:uncharacterized protein DUF1622 [Micromonospora pisi]|uniref:Uncharacterized protein DUF1622 n=1 Tax=Micromonospora pisi TaxID=589240 RepID=A0A495JAH3_9ACTN|nr:DUF1622 domain-containing protein [Micromonospora pisi]RKR86030.1 uncharacterized protein DUF1622 [Micromonospora pisi]
MIRSTLVDLITAFALVTGVVTVLAVRNWRIALRLVLDLLTAASLIRLAATEHWRDLATAATIVLLRTVIGALLSTSAAPRRRGPTARRSSGRPDSAVG